MSKPKLLLADDSVTIRKVVELTFADEGIDVFPTGDATTAMERFVEIQPDIVLVDAGLEGTNGYQICEMIKADDATRHIPVMLLVGSFEPFDADEAHRVGADGFMTKPFHSIRDLVNRVSMLLGNSRQPNTAEADTGLGEEISDVALSSSEQNISESAFSDSEPVRPETADIDHLYRRSFGETPEPEPVETFDSFSSASIRFNGIDIDDDMIEASYIEPREPEQPIGEFVEDDRSDRMREFDWSPDAVVAAESEAPPAAEKELDPADWAEDDANSETPEDDVAESGRVSDLSSFDTIEFDNAPAILPTSAEVSEDDDDDEELLALFDEIDDVDPAIHDTVPYAEGEQPPIIETNGDRAEVSTDTIEKIVKMVVARLSDSVVRDIARVEVPRIAEKLIREALEQEKKG